MSSNSLKYEIRYLKQTDIDDVKEIAAFSWGGHDYLQHSFKKWLQDKNSHTVGIIIDDKVVSLANLRIIENGHTGWMEGLRVHPTHRGKGLANIITNQIVEIAIEKQVKRLRYTTASDNAASIHLAESVGMSVKSQLGVFWKENPKEVLWRSAGQVIEIPFSQALNYIKNAEIFPDGIIIHDWKAFDADEDSLQWFDKESSFLIANSEEDVASFSIGCERYEGDEKYWSVSIYANKEAQFCSHLSHHLEIASESYSGLFVIFSRKFTEMITSFSWIMDSYRLSEELLSILLFERVL